jgi:conjugative transposon TraJ protein
MKMCRRAAMIAVVGMLCPFLSHAQSSGGVADYIGGLQGVLDTLYTQMIPMCSQLIGVGSGIAGFAALWYIAARIWRHLANAEPIDFYPLFRPFVLGFCVINFGMVIAMMNGIMQPTVTGTAKMVDHTNDAVAALLKQKEVALKNTNDYKMYIGDDNSGDRDKWYAYTHSGESASKESNWDVLGNDLSFALDKAQFKMTNSIKKWMSEILEVVFQAAALCINTLRTFQLIILAILGPLVFGIAVFDGFQHTLTAWIARYINIFLWLPVCNVFGAIIAKVQVQMLQIDIDQMNKTGVTNFNSTDTGYLIFMLIGIVGYFTVPSVANSIVHAGGLGAMLQKVTNMSVGTVSSRASQTAGAIGNIPKSLREGYSGKDGGSGMAGSIGRELGNSGAGSYMAGKLSGKPTPSDAQKKGG